MTGAKPRRFGITKRLPSEQLAEDFQAVFAGDLASRPSVALELPIDAIEPSPYQARVQFDALDELVQAIRVHGFTSRVRVRPHPTQPERYQLVFGERRLRAAQAAGLAMIPADVAEHSDNELREIGLTENVLRRDLSPLEEGRAFVAALEAGYSLRSLSERIGKASKGYVENRVAIARAPEDVQAMVEQRPDTLRAARALTALATEQERRPLIAGLLAGTLTANDVDAVVREQRSGSANVEAGAPVSEHATPAAPHGSADADLTQRETGVARAAVPGAPPHRMVESGAHAKRIEREIAQVLSVVGRWRESPPGSNRERQVLGRGIARIVAELDALVLAVEGGLEP